MLFQLSYKRLLFVTYLFSTLSFSFHTKHILFIFFNFGQLLRKTDRAWASHRPRDSTCVLTSHAPNYHHNYFMESLNEVFNGASENRTHDLLLAKQTLSQLSYNPERIIHSIAE